MARAAATRGEAPAPGGEQRNGVAREEPAVMVDRATKSNLPRDPGSGLSGEGRDEGREHRGAGGQWCSELAGAGGQAADSRGSAAIPYRSRDWADRITRPDHPGRGTVRPSCPALLPSR